MTKAKPAAAAKGAEKFYDDTAGSQTAAPALTKGAAGKVGPKPPAAAKRPAAKAAAGKSGLAHLATVEVEKGNKNLTGDAGLTSAPDERITLQDDVARIRSMRKPFGAFTQKLALPQRSGYHRHWFSDEPGRVDEAKSNGWAHVLDKDQKPIRRVVGRGRDSGPMYGYAMELPSIFWEEDMAAKHDAAQARIDEIKKAPFRAKPGQAQKSDADKFYSARDEPLKVSQSDVRSSRS